MELRFSSSLSGGARIGAIETLQQRTWESLQMLVSSWLPFKLRYTQWCFLTAHTGYGGRCKVVLCGLRFTEGVLINSLLPTTRNLHSPNHSPSLSNPRQAVRCQENPRASGVGVWFLSFSFLVIHQGQCSLRDIDAEKRKVCSLPAIRRSKTWPALLVIIHLLLCTKRKGPKGKLKAAVCFVQSAPEE